MKTVLISLFAIALTANASKFIPDPSDSWDTILNMPGIEADLPQVRADGWFLNYSRVCQTADDQLRSLVELPVYEWRGSGDSEEQVIVGYEYVFTGKTYEVDVCLQESGDHCHEWGTETREYAMTRDVDVYMESGRDHRTFLFSKPFTIANCAAE